MYETLYLTFFGLFICLQASDGFLTEAILRSGGKELNPVMNWVMRKIGTVPALLAVKIPMVICIWYLLDLIPEYKMLGILILDVIYFAIIGYNVYQAVE